ncbi:MAG TPA: ADP-ribosylglycohydrolase family protein [Armatimonadota bacterium]|jgi:ADP-ribosylglycohydrolase
MPNRTNWSNLPWLLVNRTDLTIEREQCRDEGLDLSSVEAEFDALTAGELTTPEDLARAEALLDRTASLPLVEDYPWREPSDLPCIRTRRPAALELPARALDEATLLDKALGGWQGRCSGCLLGKPVEGKRAWMIEKYLQTQKRWPLDRYFSAACADAEIAKECTFDGIAATLCEEGITCMVEDDDTNYTVLGLALVKQHGPNFTPVEVARFWLDNLPVGHVCTAERAAYRNLVNMIGPPESASYRNVYREWIGAQIRADFFGYMNPGNLERAAEFAWRDASISHVKNGIYGEMWVAAMLAAAYICDDVETVLRAGLSQIPAECRLTKAILQTIEQYRSGLAYEEAVADLQSRWDENNQHHWCHTISNAEIVAIALLWGEQDFERTICRAVMPGFDTDCNGATAGSILGIMLGAQRLPEKWIAPLQDTLLTGVAGYHRVSLNQMAQDTVSLREQR